MTKNAILVTVALIVAFTAGVLVGNLTAGEDTVATRVADSVENGLDTASQAMNSGGEANSYNVPDGDAVAFTLSIDSLSESQKSMLRTMGVDANEIQVTNNMMACAEAEIGGARINEIRNGATPSMGEGIALMGCYTAN